jgi:GNAT superfamily N-acetyltransferase
MDALALQLVVTEADKDEAGSLLREYLGWLNERLTDEYGLEFEADVMVQSDLSDPVKFQPPFGRFYVALLTDLAVGIGCLKKMEEGVAELQRMYVSPQFRGKGIGRAIANRLIEDARSIGYRKLRLESLDFLREAHSLYRSLGFHEIEPYADNSMRSYQSAEQLDQYYSIAVFMEMDL